MPRGIPGSIPVITCPKCGKKRKYCANGMCKTCYNCRYNQEHRKEQAARMRHYYKNCEEYREADLARSRRWTKENHDKKAAHAANRRAREKAVANTLTSERLKFERRIGEATYPGEELHLHHIVPIGRGGGHTWGNIVFIPSSLNLSIRDKLPEEVYKQLKFPLKSQP